MRKFRIIYIPISLTVLYQTLVLVFLPLTYTQNDAAWYYMNIHFVEAGTYINEDLYPSFKEPSQLYPFFGYSIFLYLLKLLSFFSSFSWPVIVKSVQYVLYLFTGALLYKITNKVTGKKNLSELTVLLYLLYFPYFLYTTYLMSETYALFLLALVIYHFICFSATLKKQYAAVCFFVSGCLLLVKPSFTLIFLLLLLLYLIILVKRKCVRLPFFLIIGFITVFPAMQAVFSKVYYGNYQIRSGKGWNLWNRVIFYDRLFPKYSAAFIKLRSEYEMHGYKFQNGYWWDITQKLSQFGYSEKETQKLCGDIARDGIVENTGDYFRNTFINMCLVFQQPMHIPVVFPTTTEYQVHNKLFGYDRQHIPLVKQLAQQPYFQEYFFAQKFVFLNHKIASYLEKYSRVLHNSLVIACFVLTMLINLVIWLYKKLCIRAGTVLLINWIPFSILFASNLTEIPHARYVVPTIIFVLLSFLTSLNFWGDLLQIKSSEIPGKAFTR